MNDSTGKTRSRPDPQEQRHNSKVQNPATTDPDFVLEDFRGEEHEYIVTAHDPDEAIPTIIQFISIARSPLAKFVDANLSKVFDAATSKGTALDADVATLFDNTSIDELSTEVVGALRQVDMVAMVTSLLKHTQRDGYDLAERQNFNDAYRRNYQEMIMAVWYVLRWNGFLGSAGMPSDE
jgi:hypothetical protein